VSTYATCWTNLRVWLAYTNLTRRKSAYRRRCSPAGVEKDRALIRTAENVRRFPAGGANELPTNTVDPDKRFLVGAAREVKTTTVTTTEKRLNTSWRKGKQTT